MGSLFSKFRRHRRRRLSSQTFSPCLEPPKQRIRYDNDNSFDILPSTVQSTVLPTKSPVLPTQSLILPQHSPVVVHRSPLATPQSHVVVSQGKTGQDCLEGIQHTFCSSKEKVTPLLEEMNLPVCFDDSSDSEEECLCCSNGLPPKSPPRQRAGILRQSFKSPLPEVKHKLTCFDDSRANDDDEERSSHGLPPGSPPKPMARSAWPNTTQTTDLSLVKNLKSNNFHKRKMMRISPKFEQPNEQQIEHPIDQQIEHPIDQQIEHPIDQQIEHPIDQREIYNRFTTESVKRQYDKLLTSGMSEETIVRLILQDQYDETDTFEFNRFMAFLTMEGLGFTLPDELREYDVNIEHENSNNADANEKLDEEVYEEPTTTVEKGEKVKKLSAVEYFESLHRLDKRLRLIDNRTHMQGNTNPNIKFTFTHKKVESKKPEKPAEIVYCDQYPRSNSRHNRVRN
ncbi:hypothetical protein RCL1_008686 [Eukaryota sp. TZLM3-RCL]